LTLNSSKTEYLLIGNRQHLTKIGPIRLYTTLLDLNNSAHCARNLGFIFDVHLALSDQISALSKSYIRLYLDLKTASRLTIATSIVHSKVDNCNSIPLLPDPGNFDGTPEVYNKLK